MPKITSLGGIAIGKSFLFTVSDDEGEPTYQGHAICQAILESFTTESDVYDIILFTACGKFSNTPAGIAAGDPWDFEYNDTYLPAHISPDNEKT